ncbi:MAG: YciI family protein [Dehalococcoidia bacterium]
MKYALLISGEGGEAPDATGFDTFCERLRARGAFRGGRRFRGTAVARSVRMTDGGPVVTSGPTNQDSVQLGAFVVAECDGEEEATALASEFVAASGATVEIRQVAAPGEGGPDAEKEGVEASSFGTLPEFAFLMNVEDEKRPWPGSRAFDELMENCGKVLTHLQERGRFRGTERLVPSTAAKTIRPASGMPRVLDGPFSEAREVIGGFILGECDGIDEAARLAALLPGAASGSVEVREVLR